jgi:hypothetical protein
VEEARRMNRLQHKARRGDKRNEREEATKKGRAKSGKTRNGSGINWLFSSLLFGFQTIEGFSVMVKMDEWVRGRVLRERS